MDTKEFNKAIERVTSPLPGSSPESVKYKLTVKKRFEGLSIIDFYLAAVPGTKKERWINKVNSGNLKVNGNIVPTTYRVKAGDMTQHKSEPKTEPSVSASIKLLYEDDHLLVINKPAPLPVHASGRFVRNTLLNILNSAFPNDNYRLLHRLDANTTGVVVLAKSKEVANAMRIAFEDQQISKVYYALAEGLVDEKTTQASAKVGTEVLSAGGRALDESGKEALTHISIEQIYPESNTTLLRIKPETGRTNQIRLHLAHLGHPIVGDIGHKDPSYFKSNPFTYPEDTLFLHAAELSFTHPETQKRVIFNAPLPSKFMNC